jgi:hypothetical protein
MFSFVHKKTARSYYEQPQKQQQVVMPVKMHFAYRQVPVQQVQQPLAKPDANPLPKMKWGRPIWTFFHVMAQKMKSEYFNLVIKDFLRFILLICGTLPCPVCSAHASEYMRSINLNNMRCKEDLIQLFYNFHNVVNQRKGYAVLQKDQIPQYETANTVIAIKDFVRAFEDKSRAMKLMADDLSRARISTQFKFWINGNIQYFEP